MDDYGLECCMVSLHACMQVSRGKKGTEASQRPAGQMAHTCMSTTREEFYFFQGISARRLAAL